MDLHSSTGFPHPHYTVVSRDNYPRGYCTPLTIPWLDALAHNIFKIIIIRRLYVASHSCCRAGILAGYCVYWEFRSLSRLLGSLCVPWVSCDSRKSDLRFFLCVKITWMCNVLATVGARGPQWQMASSHPHQPLAPPVQHTLNSPAEEPLSSLSLWRTSAD